MPIQFNKTFLVIGLVTDIFMQKDLLQKDGFIDLEKAGSIVSLGLDAYASVNIFERFEHAKPNILPQKIVRI